MGGSKFSVGEVGWDVGSFLGLWSYGDAEEGKNSTHHGLVIAEVMWHASIGMDSEVVGVGDVLFLVRGEGKHDGVGFGELMSGVENGYMWLESKVADDLLDASEGDSIWSGIVAGEA